MIGQFRVRRRLTSSIIINFVLVIFMLAFSVPKATATDVLEISDENRMSIALLGIDTGSAGRVEQGRSDVIMLLSMNSEEQEGIIASIPRDSYVEIPGYGMDKLNHAYAFGGADLTLETLNLWLNTNIENYISVNMAGLAEIVNAVGTITVVPPSTFSIGGYDFYAGQPTELNGEAALAYARERYTSGGDYARQERQRDIVEAVINEAASVQSLLNFINLFSAVSDNIETNLSLPALFQVFIAYQQVSDNIEHFQLTGAGINIDGIYYEEINTDALNHLTSYLNN